MTDKMTALSRRAIACKGWRWLPGTLRLRATPPSRRDHLLREGRVPDCGDPWVYEDWPVIPDVTDAATLGCLLALVREAWRCPTTYVRQGSTRRVSDGVLAWEVCDLWLDAEACRALGVDRQGSVGSWGHGSEAEALVAALESAP